MEVERITGTVITTPNLAGHTVDQLAGRWLAGYRSPNTRDAYRRDLLAWLSWSASHGVNPMDAQREHVDAYARAMESAGRKPTTVARALAAVSSFYRWCVEGDHLPANPAAHVRRPPTSEGYVALTPALDRDELGRLVSVATSPQDRALVLLLAVLGLRVSEALTLELDAVEEVRGHRTVVVSGKGGRQDRMPLPPVVVDALTQLAEHEGRTSGPVFVSAQTGERMTRHGVARALARLSRAAGLSGAGRKTLRPHVMRATAITSALEAGAPLRDVQDMARHADPRTTRRYDRAAKGLDRHASYVVAGWLPTPEPVG